MNTSMALMAGGFGWGELVVVVLVVLLLFGAKRVPDLARSLGRSLSEFKKGRAEGEKGEIQATTPDETVSRKDDQNTQS